MGDVAIKKNGSYVFEPTYSFLLFYLILQEARGISRKNRAILDAHLAREVNFQLTMQRPRQAQRWPSFLPSRKLYRAFYKTDCLVNNIVKDRNVIFVKLLIDALVEAVPRYN